MRHDYEYSGALILVLSKPTICVNLYGCLPWFCLPPLHGVIKLELFMFIVTMAHGRIKLVLVLWVSSLCFSYGVSLSWVSLSGAS